MCSPRPGGAGPVGRVLVPQSGRFQVDLKGEALAWSKGRQPQPYTCSHDRPLHCCASLQPLCAHLPLPAPPCPPVRPPSPPLPSVPLPLPGILYETEAVPLPCTLALVQTKNAGSELVRAGAAARSIGTVACMPLPCLNTPCE